MNDLDELFEQAETLRISGRGRSDFVAAVGLYRKYILGGGERECDAYHMMALCYQHFGDRATMHYFARALSAAKNDHQRANIYRDMARTLFADGKRKQAFGRIDAALALLPLGAYPAEYGATLGFQARLLMENGQIGRALAGFKRADEILRGAENRHFELYNALYYAVALSRNREPLNCRRVAHRALRLASTDEPGTGRKYGSPTHRLRAMALMIGGHRLEEALRAVT